MRITRKVFHDLAIWMVGFGLSIGIVFPFFVILLGVPSNIALNKVFFAACLGAGALAGIINYGLARWVVGLRLRLLASSMSQVEQNLKKMTYSGDLSECTPENCMIYVDSEDEIGESALAFNRLVETLSKSMKTQAAVRSFSEMLTSQLEIETLAEKALLQFFEHTDAASGLVLYESGGKLEIAASHGLKSPELVAVSDHVRIAVRTGQRQVVSIPDDVRIDGVIMDFSPREIVVLPVKNKGVPLGVVVLATGKTFDSDQQARIDIFMQGLGLALNNAMAHDHLRRLAAIDPLTSIYNRRFGLGRLKEEFGRATRTGSLLGIIIFDIDHFKVVNDTYGHLVGDWVLKSICALARSSLREGDVLFRYGGEEFVAVLPAASSEDLRIIAERLRKGIEDNIFSKGITTVRVTVSIGGAAYPNQSNAGNEDLLLQLADEALYKAKESGRNRVILAH
ncbi:GGDEF domain-containing protein [Desulfopila sp. IMCC35006]|uniref:sensor domain-containing diguanylate cyclase n=1 Tax=Desulfopila sp. IMCC35006 TaxID=2569542 RepID=UPI0010ABEAEB|nr:sensor domain-containing diguanylate cyclase [Desulfopila sp. IMCC35006]TKB23111.1 GGDEF domain-containing protein [Desulfopila sp. IMCC35006]